MANQGRPDLENDDQQMAEFQELISGDYDYLPPRRGQVREVLILSISEHGMMVDLGAKRDGMVLESDLDVVDERYREALKVGDSIPVTIIRLWGSDEIIVSLSLGLQQEDWLRGERLVESEELVMCEVVATNRGGVVARLGRLDGFVPNSHLGSAARTWPPDHIDEAKTELVGQILSLAVIEVDQARRRLVLSQRVAERRQRQKLEGELAPGQVRVGTVRSLVPFGAFVDLGGIDGLVHVSELDWQHVDHPSDVVQVGDQIQVRVLSVDPERRRIGLSRKRLLPNPWDEIAARFEAGDTLQGTITMVKPFGMFVEIGQGVRGLIRTNEHPGTSAVPESEYQPGSQVHVTVLNVDHVKHQVDLAIAGHDALAEVEDLAAQPV